MALIADRIGKSKTSRNSAPSEGLLSKELVGLEFEVEGYRHGAGVTENQLMVRDQMWSSKPDGSLRNGIEFVFRGPKAGTAVVDAVDSFFGTAKFSTSSRTGFHVHLNMTEDGDTDEVAKNLLLVYLLLEPAIYAYAGEDRRWCGFSQSIADSESNLMSLVKLFSEGPMSTPENMPEWHRTASRLGRYAGLNFQALMKFGTVEFRHLGMPESSGPVIEWVNVILGIKREAKRLIASGESILSRFKGMGADRYVFELFNGKCPNFAAHCTKENLYKGMQYVSVANLMFEEEKIVKTGTSVDSEEDSHDTPDVGTSGPDAARAFQENAILTYLRTGEIIRAPEPKRNADNWWVTRRATAKPATPADPGRSEAKDQNAKRQVREARAYYESIVNSNFNQR